MHQITLLFITFQNSGFFIIPVEFIFPTFFMICQETSSPNKPKSCFHLYFLRYVSMKILKKQKIPTLFFDGFTYFGMS